MKILKAKHECDENCNHEKKFTDPVLQGLNEELNNSFSTMLEALSNDIVKILNLPEPIEKAGKVGARTNHKYIRKESRGGKDVYIYKDDEGHEYARGDKEDEKGHKHTEPGKKIKVRVAAPKFVTVRQKGAVKMESAAQKMPEPSGKPLKPQESTVPYDHPHNSVTNMVGEVMFGNASPVVQKKFNTGIRGIDSILQDAGIRMKTPIHFWCGAIDKASRVGAKYHLQGEGEIFHSIEMVSDKDYAKSLAHEIGHAIDHSLAESKGLVARSAENISDKQIKFHMNEMMKLFKESEYYKTQAGNKTGTNEPRDKQMQDYLNIPSEGFARCFEVYCYQEAQKRAETGKDPNINDEFMNNFFPDLHKTGRGMPDFAQKKRMDVINKQIAFHMKAVLSKDKIRKSLGGIEFIQASKI